MDEINEEWLQYRKLVLAELERLDRKTESNYALTNTLSTEIAIVKAKLLMAATVISAVMAAAVGWFFKHI